jgi:hypothetical protein
MLLQSLVALLTVSSLYSSHAHAAGSDSIVVITDPQRNTLRVRINFCKSYLLNESCAAVRHTGSSSAELPSASWDAISIQSLQHQTPDIRHQTLDISKNLWQINNYCSPTNPSYPVTASRISDDSGLKQALAL